MFKSTEPSPLKDKTLELCQTILDHPEYGTIRQQISAFQADNSAQSQFQEVLQKGDELQQKQRSGAEMSGDEITAFEKDRQALLDNPTAKGFLEAQEAMHHVQTSIGQFVTKTFELGRLPQADDFEAGDCGPGCGCDH